MPDDEKPKQSETPEKHRLFAKAADIATNVMNESAKAMVDESKKIDAKDYELSHMVATVTKVVNAGIAGATDLARIPLEEKWPEPHLVMGEYISSCGARHGDQSGQRRPGRRRQHGKDGVQTEPIGSNR